MRDEVRGQRTFDSFRKGEGGLGPSTFRITGRNTERNCQHLKETVPFTTIKLDKSPVLTTSLSPTLAESRTLTSFFNLENFLKKIKTF